MRVGILGSALMTTWDLGKVERRVAGSVRQSRRSLRQHLSFSQDVRTSRRTFARSVTDINDPEAEIPALSVSVRLGAARARGGGQICRMDFRQSPPTCAIHWDSGRANVRCCPVILVFPADGHNIFNAVEQRAWAYSCYRADVLAS